MYNSTALCKKIEYINVQFHERHQQHVRIKTWQPSFTLLNDKHSCNTDMYALQNTAGGEGEKS